MLSTAAVTLSILALNKLIGGTITGLNYVLTIVAITIILVVFYPLKRVIGDERAMLPEQPILP